MASKTAEDAIEPASPIGLKVSSPGAAGAPQGGGGRVQAPGASYATVCLGSGSPGVAGTEGHFPVRGGSVQISDMSVCLGGGPPSAVDITGAAGHSSVRGGSVRASGVENGRSVCSVGAAGHSPVRGGSVRVPVPASEPVQSGRHGDGVVGGAGVRSEGQPQAQAVTSPMEEEPSESTPATAKPAKKTLLKPAVLQVPASPGYVRHNASVGGEDDGCGSVVNEKSACGSVSGVNNGGSSGGMNTKSGMDDENCGVNVGGCSGVNGGPGSESGSGSAAPPVVTAPRSYAHVAAGGSPSPSGPGGQSR
ncbi:collagen alpha-1(I) chain-like [Hyla sarda]|uniref:collagen alpha-1(I) chain-like n=1 Tax=Hyla sarda TaxID=327740 RepID=UPI0024C2DAD8|nr:collagen alpha-1(I) chain-like [Hyla sarda]